MPSVSTLTPQTFSYLVQQAKKNTVINYKDVAEAVGTHHRVVPKVLERIRTICIDYDLPPLTAIVVSKMTGKPGKAFLDPWMSRDATDEQKDRRWREMQDEVFSFHWEPYLVRFGDKQRNSAYEYNVHIH